MWMEALATAKEEVTMGRGPSRLLPIFKRLRPSSLRLSLATPIILFSSCFLHHPLGLFFIINNRLGASTWALLFSHPGTHSFFSLLIGIFLHCIHNIFVVPCLLRFSPTTPRCFPNSPSRVWPLWSCSSISVPFSGKSTSRSSVSTFASLSPN